MSRPMSWGEDSDMGKVLRALVVTCDSWEDVRTIINNTFGTDYTLAGIKSAAHRQGFSMEGKSGVVRKAQTYQERYGMRGWDDIPTYTIEDKREWVPFAPFGDMHIGNECYLEDVMDTYIEYWTDIEAYLFGMGDILETCIPHHLPQAMWSQQCTPREQSAYAKWKLAPLKERLVGMIPGNHENRIINSTDIDPIEHICELFGCLYLRRGGLVNVRAGNQHYLFLFKHGKSFSKNHKLEVENFASIYPDADVVCLGHVHINSTFVVNERFSIDVNTEGSKRRLANQIGVRTGHALGYGGYVEDRPYKPHKPGFPLLWLNTKEKAIRSDDNGAFITEVA